MSNLSRKQREIAERHNRFLTIGRSLLEEAGFQHLSMDRVAELAEYSKGTIYQHFNCKEELLGQLCVHSTQRLQALTQRAFEHSGPYRERVLAFVIAHDVYRTDRVEDMRLMRYFLTDPVLEKLSPKTLERYRSLQRDMINSLKRLVDDAIEAGDLPAPRSTSADIVVAVWSLIHGAEALRSRALPPAELGACRTGVAVVEMVERLLDGLKWVSPTANNTVSHESTTQRVERLKNALFTHKLPAAQ